MKNIAIVIFLLITILSCNNSNSVKLKELELKEKELELKKMELEKNKKITNNEIDIKKTEGNNQLSNIENLIGNWFIPHGATINIKFSRDNRFEFNDYNSNTNKEEFLVGSFKLENGTLTLLYDDRPKQNFKFYKGNNGDNNYYIKNGGYLFVKGENGN